ncbi:MAG: ABC transporter ATP-binding protein, partial [Synergistaceae bacterium]|nr:ABC transporter ATP-binding protein [Synergistaceae bacterium]
MKEEFAVEVKGLTKVFGTFTAVDHIDLEVIKGKIFGFLGPNGAGKSTTIKMLCGLLLPTSGEGIIAGSDIYRESEEIKKKIGYMSQKFSLYDDLTVEENIDFFAGIYKVPKSIRPERKAWILEMSDLTTHTSSITRSLAGGWKQRLALGCALIHQPPIVFLDEPTSGVDPISRRRFWNLISDIAREGTTVFVTTHYMEEAEYCDELALIYKGKMIAKGTPTSIRKDSMPSDLIELAVSSPFEAIEVLENSGSVASASIFGDGLHLILKNGEYDGETIKKILSEKS